MRLRVVLPWRRTVPLPGPFVLVPSRRHNGLGGGAFLLLLIYVGAWFAYPTAAVVVTVIVGLGIAAEVVARRGRR